MAKSVDGRAAIDMVLSRDNGDGGGALCNDPSGLNLHSRGNIDASKAGAYTSLARLAAQLDGGGGVEAPVISIETDNAATIVKEYAGHCVVMRVPASKAEEGESAGDTEVSGAAQQPQEGGQ
uniref:Late endosomal/lysosomal adaptor and MAPK and MTOR activator 5 n=1 Tax=Minutocellus polymorphus TaxID=265543 RepID=A0A6U0KGZ7_9STRA|mmetsp:Transcript_35/g.60  ORF Transcript_35/g.60 Transcript_35/m.60 type:complete len:122 (+) Transcript_35:95-460(+)|eukprot:CAMPEP_0197725930 /NCGR_PEP_ID=MMETSP1434-20131217/12154_1 /TAXON_ID=265543 /ORGANISM="Minutocellus polymorphus, Strain CCMP3303" /LENGTH=121 /DNA_ID=CAMNT_0043311675 /DNA_START=88 /DNA_END=453 /DNA_ORIENTATION=+